MPLLEVTQITVIFNITERENGQDRALQPQSLFASQHATRTLQGPACVLKARSPSSSSPPSTVPSEN